MNPKKPKVFIKPTAEALGQTESLVEDIVSFYWSSVRKALSELESPSITITNLGIFKVKYNQIPKLEKKYENYLKALTPESMTFNKHTIQNTSKEKLEKLERIREQMDEEFKRRTEVRLKRKEYVTNRSLEKQRKDS